MTLRRYRPIAVLLLGLQLAGCTRWEPTVVSPRTVVEGEKPSAVRVTRADGSRIEVEKPLIRSDSILSGEGCERVFTSDGRAACSAATPSVALSDVRALAVQRTDIPKTMLAVVASPVILIATIAGLCVVAPGCEVLQS